MTHHPKSIKSCATAYIKRGFSLLPLHTAINRGGDIVCSCGAIDCTSAAKHPVAKLVRNGLKGASSDPATIKQWFGGFSQNNIGIATGAISGIVVVDVDARHGGEKSLQKLEEKYGELPTTLRWCTGGGGEHILFQHPGKEIRNSAGKLGDGIDVRGDGGYIVAPPSRHKSGNYYQLHNGQSLSAPLAVLPTWLLVLMQQSGGGKQHATPIKQIVRECVPEGQRNTTIARLSGHLLAKRVDPVICLDLMLAFNTKFCAPPLAEKEVMQIVASIDRLSFTKFSMNK